MAFIVFALGLLLTIAGCGGLLASVDLLPTEVGLLYAGCGVISVCAGFTVISIGVLVRRVEALGSALGSSSGANWRAADGASREAAAQPSDAPQSVPRGLQASAHSAPAVPPPEAEEEPSEPAEEDEPVNENRSGHIPTLHEFEEAIAHPEEPPTLVGRYSAGGANYMIFSDGTIEAETEEGQFRFASMGDFKAYIAGRRE